MKDKEINIKINKELKEEIERLKPIQEDFNEKIKEKHILSTFSNENFAC